MLEVIAIKSTSQHICQICSNALDMIEGLPATCARCGHKDFLFARRSNRLSLVFSLTALIFYLPANIFPFMTIEMYGRRNSSTIWSGVVSLMEQRSYGIAIVVFLASILIPVMKLLILFYLSFKGGNGHRPHFKTQLYRLVEAVGRWSMLDIFLLAILVAIVKLGHWTTVSPEKGSGLFLMVVIFTMMASAYFDPRILWKNTNEKDIK
ncbi:MAG: paraquat-inducible protein A [Bdellovibrionales bacterium]